MRLEIQPGSRLTSVHGAIVLFGALAALLLSVPASRGDTARPAGTVADSVSGALAAPRHAAVDSAVARADSGAAAAVAPTPAPPAGFPVTSARGALVSARILAPDHLRVRLSRPVAGLTPADFRFTSDRAPDVPIEVRSVEPQGADRVLLGVGERVDASQAYLLELRDPPSRMPMRPSPWALLLTAVMSAALINNFVFTRYLGLCIFFGVTRRRDTAIGMGITFTLVMIGTAMLSWALYTWAMLPLKLKFLQVLVFIGVVAVVVQFLDTMLRKTHASLHKKFGIYLVLITTNCIILAVPLLNAASGAGPAEAVALALGSGLGFGLALFLMSCAREKVELARVPQSFSGLPIAFALAGLFALAFMGFSGLNFLR
jgi:electron transport complex protein RnfA